MPTLQYFFSQEDVYVFFYLLPPNFIEKKIPKNNNDIMCDPSSDPSHGFRFQWEIVLEFEKKYTDHKHPPFRKLNVHCFKWT
jgi:hypothetical protein